MPTPSPEFVLMRVALQALVSTLSKKKADAFLRAMAEILADEESLSEIMPIRPASSAAAVSKARRAALAMYKAYLPVLLAAQGRRDI